MIGRVGPELIDSGSRSLGCGWGEKGEEKGETASGVSRSTSGKSTPATVPVFCHSFIFLSQQTSVECLTYVL